MIRDSELHDRFVEAAGAHTADVGAALSSMAGTVKARRQRRVAMFTVAAVAVIGLVAAGLSLLPSPHDPKTPEAPVRIELPPPDVTTHQTVAGLEAKVLTQIASDEHRVGMNLGVPRIVAVTYLASGWPTPSPDWLTPHTGMRFDRPTWAVEYRGTTLSCSSWCSLHPGGIIWFDDKTGDDLELVPMDAVCEPFQLETPMTGQTTVVSVHPALPPCLTTPPTTHI
jgi:hypothetical protein